MDKDEIVRLLKLALEMHEEVGINLGFTPAGEKFAADLRAAVERMEQAAPAVLYADCSICTNRGGVYALSQESNCDHCVWQGRKYKKDLFAAAPQPAEEGGRVK